MALKTNFKDDIFSGARRYQMVTNDDGTVSMVDVTVYTQEGDRFGANEINGTNAAINRIDRDVVVNLPLSGWSAAAPYTIRVAVPGVKAADNPELKVYTPKTLDAATVKLRQKLTGMITDGMTEDGYVTLYCGVKKPTADFVVLLKGVSVNE